MRRLLCCLAGCLLLAASAGGNPACGPQTLDDLKRLSGDQLMDLFRSAEVGRPLDGTFKGRMVRLEGRLPRLRLALTNAFWTGKRARASDGWFINRFRLGVEWASSNYVVGPSWLDGKPAILMDYPPRTPVFGNIHDELREVAPGLYLGPVYDKCPCPKLRGWVAVQAECGCK